MGTGHSSGDGTINSTDLKYKRLYKELRNKDNIDNDQPNNQPNTVTDQEFKSRFIHYFGGPCQRLGELLYGRLFSGAGTMNEETFVSVMKDFQHLSGSDSSLHEAEKFYFFVFSQGKNSLGKEGLIEVLRIACVIALVVGSELHETVVVPMDTPIIESMVSSAMLVADSNTHELSVTQFTVWLTGHCPKLLEGINHWIETLLCQQDDKSDVSSFHTSYRLPAPKLPDGATQEQINYMYILIWTLSTRLPLIYMGHKNNESTVTSSNKHPVGGVWTNLYSSSDNGLSMNRLQSHCFDYCQPSLMIITTRDTTRTEHQYLICVDKEWRDGTYFWGEKDCCLLELKPNFTLLKTGAKLISLNQKQRGFPTGLRVMADDSYRSATLFIDSSLDKGEMNGLPLTIDEIVVWGCGGEEAADSQKKIKDWETKEILRRRKINKDELKETWMESPDRYLLELGGVRVTNPKEQQQE